MKSKASKLKAPETKKPGTPCQEWPPSKSFILAYLRCNSAKKLIFFKKKVATLSLKITIHLIL
jgi:hypothetical protein